MDFSFLKEILNNLPDNIYILDEKGKIVFVNNNLIGFSNQAESDHSNGWTGSVNEQIILLKYSS